MERLTMATQADGGGVRVVLTGELDLAQAYEFDARMREIEAQAPERIVLDISELLFVDSAGLGRIMAVHKRSRLAGRPLILTRAPRAVQRVLAVAALDHVLEFESPPAAA
jgi:anti-anti-sigma factor